MTKRLREDWLYIAPHIIGRRVANVSEVIDELNQKTLDPDDEYDKITIYERQVQQWFIQPATQLIKKKENEFIVFMIALSYVEGVEQYRKGTSSNHNSKPFFISSMKRIFGLTDADTDNLGVLYTQARCGLFHNGMTSEKIVLNSSTEVAIDFSDPDMILVNPKRFLKRITEDFEEYIEIMRKPEGKELRDKFSHMFSVL